MKARIRALITAALTTTKANPVKIAQRGRWETSAAGYRAIPLTRGYVALVDAALTRTRRRRTLAATNGRNITRPERKN